MNLKEYIANIPGFPKEPVIFRDVTPILENAEVFQYVTDKFSEFAKEIEADVIVGPEARGFIFGTPVSLACKIGFVPVRKPGKLPRKTVEVEYSLEYGTDKLCIHEDSIQPGQKVLIIDDLLATGGSANAAKQLVEKLGGIVVGAAFVVELDDLQGKKVLGDIKVCSLTHYEGE
ncbi:MAG: adenine phosphoribosyltransferase [Bacillota bacterium]|nr:adenine phosphoribosyltransferase [Bacillota bacterium]